jgi:O-antigen/teichoic acid export membrane protein
VADLKKVVYNTTYYTVSTILLRASSLIFFPIFSLYLTESDYGTFSVVQSIVLIVGLLGGLGLNSVITRFIYYNVDSKKNDHSSIIYTTLISNFCGQLFFVCLLMLFGPYIFGSILKDIPFYPYVFIGLLTLPLNSLIETARVYFKAVHEGKKAFLLDMSFFSMNIMFNLVFIIGLGFNVLGLFLGVFLNTILFSIILLIIFYSKFKLRFDSDLWKGMVKYALPLLPFIFLNVVFESIDKFFLNAYWGASYSGIYYLALIFASIFSSIKESVISALSPWVFENIKSVNTNISIVFNAAMLLTGILGFVISLFAKEVLMLISSNPDFIIVYKYVPLTIISFYIIFLGQLFNIKTYYYGSYHGYLFIATIFGIVTEVIFCYMLIHQFGVLGAVLSRIMAFLVQTSLFIYFSKKEKEFKNMYNYRFLLICFMSMSFLISIPFYVTFDYSLLINLLIKFGLLLAVIVLLFLVFKNEFKHSIKLFKDRFPILERFL